jgi:iron complex transport system substrate-binding protein
VPVIIILVLLLVDVSAEASITVQDDLGNTIRLDHPARRIVSLAPHLTEILFYLGLGDKVVGVVEFSDFPREAMKVKRVGNAFSVSVEAVVELKPDLILVWSTGGSREQVRKLESLGIPVYYSEPRVLSEVAEGFERIALLAGEGQRGSQAKQKFQAQLQEVGRVQPGNNVPRVFFQVSATDLYTVNDSHLMGQAISLCGGKNIFGSINVPVPLVSSEAILVGQPQIIVRSADVPGQVEWRSQWQKYQQIPAVADNHLYEVSADLISRPGFRMLQGIRQLCDIIGGVATTPVEMEGSR